MKSNPYVTVFIPTYYGEQYLDQLLASVFAQKVNFVYEVLVYDTSSKDNTINIIESYAKKHKKLRYKVITKEEYGHGKTRRDAAYDAKGDIVVYLSQDAIPANDRWLYEITRPFSLNDNIVGVVGKQTPRRNCVPLLKYEINSVFGNFGSDLGTSLFYKDDFLERQDQYDFVSFYSDVNSAARKSILTGEIPYKPVSYAEDQLFGRDIIDAGYIKAYAPRGVVVHSNDIPLKEYKARLFDETIGLRGVGISVAKPPLRVVTKIILKGVIKDGIKIILDREYSKKRKLYWLITNPMYHIEKWRGVRQGASVALDDSVSMRKFSLESRKSEKNKH